MLTRSLDALERTLGPDAAAWRRLLSPHIAHWDDIVDGALGPIHPLRQLQRPLASLALARFGIYALQSARGMAERTFRDDPARALFAGIAAHAMLPLEHAPTAAAAAPDGAMAHVVGWPLARGGSQRVADALAAYLRDLGGEIVTGRPVASLDELPPARAILADVTPRQLLRWRATACPNEYAQRLKRYRYGPGVFKIDFALDGPIPWRNPECLGAATVHVGGTTARDRGERACGLEWRAAGATLHPAGAAEPLRRDARAGGQTYRLGLLPHAAWLGRGYDGAHRGADRALRARLPRAHPGEERDDRAADGGLQPELRRRRHQRRAGGPLRSFSRGPSSPPISGNPYATPAPGLYLCSSSTPPGGGVHGLCGYFAAASGAAHGLRHGIEADSGKAGNLSNR